MYSNVTMKALTDCELFAITHEALNEILIFYPEGKLYISICICYVVQARVELKSGQVHPGYVALGHPGHILSGSSRSHPLFKYLGLTQILHLITCVDDGIVPDHSGELSMLDVDNRSTSLALLERLTVQ